MPGVTLGLRRVALVSVEPSPVQWGEAVRTVGFVGVGWESVNFPDSWRWVRGS